MNHFGVINMLKLWVDDVRPAPEGYKWVKSVNEAIKFIKNNRACIDRLMERGRRAFLERDYVGRNICYRNANMIDIELIDIDHDAGEYVTDGGDYIRILDWLEMNNISIPIRIHSMNPVGVQNMRAIIQKNNWKEIK